MEKLTEQQIADIVRRYQSGESGRKLAKIFAVSPTTIYNVLDLHGIERRAQIDAHRGIASEQQIADIVRRHQSGESCHALAKAFGVALRTISNTLKRQGIEPQDGRRKLTEQQIADIVQRYQAGDSRYALAKAFGVDAWTIDHALKLQGIEPQDGRRKLTEQQIADIIQRYQAGESGRRLAEAFSVTHRAIYLVLEEHNVGRR